MTKNLENKNTESQDPQIVIEELVAVIEDMGLALAQERLERSAITARLLPEAKQIISEKDIDFENILDYATVNNKKIATDVIREVIALDTNFFLYEYNGRVRCIKEEDKKVAGNEVISYGQDARGDDLVSCSKILPCP